MVLLLIIPLFCRFKSFNCNHFIVYPWYQSLYSCLVRRYMVRNDQKTMLKHKAIGWLQNMKGKKLSGKNDIRLHCSDYIHKVTTYNSKDFTQARGTLRTQRFVMSNDFCMLFFQKLMSIDFKNTYQKLCHCTLEKGGSVIHFL